MPATKTPPSRYLPVGQRISKLSFFERVLIGDCVGDPCQFMAGGSLHTGTIEAIYPRAILVRAENGVRYCLARK